MKQCAGNTVTPIQLPAIDGSVFETQSLMGRPYMLSFLRFASCPFCNLRVHEIVQRFDEFGNDFTVVAIFDSSMENLVRHAARHEAPFPILADGDNAYYRVYGIEHSVAGVLKGMVLRMPALIKGMFKGYVPWPIKGSLTTMPADFLVDRAGTIHTAYYGKDEGDHLSFDRVLEFSKALE